MQIVKIENLVKRYGDLIAIDHLNLSINQGDIVGLLGPNGCGKSTTVNCLLSLLKYDKGNIEVFGKKMTPNNYGAKRNIGIVPQEVAVLDELTVYQNIDYFCGLYVQDKKEREELVQEAIKFVGLEDFTKFLPKKLSGGLLRRLNIACGIAHKPKLIILYEPTVAVDPQSRNKILDGVVELNKLGATIIYITHYMEELEQISNNIIIMDKGKAIAQGTRQELKSMIKTGETLNIEAMDLTTNHLTDIQKLNNVISAEIIDSKLVIKCSSGSNNLMRVLEYLNTNHLIYTSVMSETPTLNEVFLEMTGKQLRD